MSEPIKGLTQAQDDAIKKAWDLLTEHFDRVLVVVDTETPEREDGHEVWWHGGYLAGLGAAEWAKVRMLEQGKLPDKDP